jgi:hypothetical protein
MSILLGFQSENSSGLLPCVSSSGLLLFVSFLSCYAVSILVVFQSENSSGLLPSVSFSGLLLSVSFLFVTLCQFFWVASLQILLGCYPVSVLLGCYCLSLF